MPQILTFEEIASELRAAILSGDTALVIGAGASFTSGAPLASGLVAEIRAKFPLAAIDEEATFLDAATEVCDTPPYGRIKLVRMLKDLLAPLEPSPSYKQIPRVKWSAIFTTNYDDLIEKAYLSPGRVQSIQPIHLPYEGNVLPRANHVLLYYLQGSIKESDESPGSPVVSWSDYLATVQQRQASMDTFRNVIASGGTVIYVGYSFGDRFLDDLLNEAARRIGNRNMPYGYAILPNWPTNRSSAAYKVERRFITPVEGSFEQFAELLNDIASTSQHPHTAIVPSPATGRALKLRSGITVLSENDAGVISEYFDVIDEQLSEHRKLPREDELHLAKAFLKGEVSGWTPYANGWAFKRDQFSDVWAAANNQDVAEPGKDPRLVLVHGPAGLGKSVMARQLAVDLYRTAGRPVLFAKATWRSRPDLGILQRALEDLEDGLPDDAELPSAVLIVDEAELFDHTIAPRIVKQVQATGRTISVILFGRTNEYFRGERGADRESPEKWGNPVEVPLREQISENEVRTLIRHIKQLDLWDGSRITSEAFWIGHVREELDSSFFDTVFSLVEQTQEPLRERVWSEYERLSPLGKDAYRLIAASHQFGLPLKMELLVRALNVTFADFETEIIRSDARDVLFSEYLTDQLNIFYRGRTRLVSSLVFERALPEIEQQLHVYERIVGAAKPSAMFGTEEVDLVRSLLVQVFGPRGFDRRFSAQQVATLFNVATEKIEDDVLEHHYGLAERDAGRLEAACVHLERALTLSHSAPIPGESIQNIENSLADILGELTLTALRNDDQRAADGYFQRAGELFVRARAGEFPNAAAYDAHARFLVRRAKMLFPKGTTERAMALSEALEIVSAGIDNVNETLKPDLVELRGSVMQELGLGELAVEELKRIAENMQPHHRARYEVIIARMMIEGPKENNKKAHRRALVHAVAATELDPRYFDGWRLRAQIFSFLHPEDFATVIDLLERARACEGGRENNWVLYELGVAQFYMEQYKDAALTFVHLRRVSRGNTAAMTILEEAGTRTGDTPFDFEGRVVRRASDGHLGIESEELQAFGEIWFNPRRQKYYDARMHDKVAFVVGLNYRGVQALDLRKL